MSTAAIVYQCHYMHIGKKKFFSIFVSLTTSSWDGDELDPGDGECEEVHVLYTKFKKVFWVLETLLGMTQLLL